MPAPHLADLLHTLEGRCADNHRRGRPRAIRLEALADAIRLQILGYMLDQPDQEACTCDLAPTAGFRTRP